VRIIALLVPALSVVVSQHDTVLTGTAKDCFETTVHPVQELVVRAFDVRANRQMLNVLLATDSIGTFEADPTAGARQDSLYGRLLDFLGSATPLAVDTSNSTGEFVLRFAPTESVFVVGIKEREGEPYYFSYKVLDGRTSRAFLLDMSAGLCGLVAAQETIQPTVAPPSSKTTSRRSAWSYIGGGAAIGGGLGLAVGVVSKNRSSDCNDCMTPVELIPLFGAVVGIVAGALTGLIVYLAR